MFALVVATVPVEAQPPCAGTNPAELFCDWMPVSPTDSVFICGVRACQPNSDGYYPVDGLIIPPEPGQELASFGGEFNTVGDGLRGTVMWTTPYGRVLQVRGDEGAVWIANDLADTTGADVSSGIALDGDNGNLTLFGSGGSTMIQIDPGDLNDPTDDVILLQTEGKIKKKKRIKVSPGVYIEVPEVFGGD